MAERERERRRDRQNVETERKRGREEKLNEGRVETRDEKKIASEK
jgi:hypothetical protein